MNTIYTVGHSVHSIEGFVSILQSFEIKCLVDVRRYPGSKRLPQFNKSVLSDSLLKSGINYLHMEPLGGMRKQNENSKNLSYRNPAFIGYADYMETLGFEIAINKLQDIANKMSTSYMCAEQNWKHCHRSMISEYLRKKGWEIIHISAKSEAKKHDFVTSCKSVQHKLVFE